MEREREGEEESVGRAGPLMGRGHHDPISSVHAITTRLNPRPTPGLPSTGLELLESDRFRLQCLQTLTGTKFLLFTEPHQPNVDVILRRVYELYADYVMKNPFYQIDMPVKCEAFDRHLIAYIKPRQ